MFESVDVETAAKIKVIGIGGGGGNAVNAMVRTEIEGVEFIVANTDSQALNKSDASVRLQIGAQRTSGLGAGSIPMVGHEAANESRDEIRDVLEGADMVFITAGMGGGTGTGAAPVIAEIAKELNILTVAVVTKPFSFEGKKRATAAEQGINALKGRVDSILVVENNKLLSRIPSGTTMLKAFEFANNVLSDAVFSIAKIITSNGLVNVDFADVSTVMKCTGRALMGVGEASGDTRAIEATEAAIECPLLEDFDMRQAKGLLCTITHGMDFGISELEGVGETVQNLTSEDATVVIGTIFDSELEDRVIITVIATGIDVEDEYASIERFTQESSMHSRSKSSSQQNPETPLVEAKSHFSNDGAEEVKDAVSSVLTTSSSVATGKPSFLVNKS